MRIEHIAIWVNDLEGVKDFYVKYFGMACNDKYVNAKKQFESYFLSPGDGSARIEIMRRAGITSNNIALNSVTGLAHFAVSVGGRDAVDALTERLRADGVVIAGEPRVTGDGYYESVVLDPEGNQIEITI